MTVLYLTISQLIEINEKILNERESCQFLYRGGIELTLFSVQFMYRDLEKHEMLIAKASHLWYEIASNQYMLYGNKRTGSAASRLFLKINGLELNLDEDQEKSISWQIAMGKITPIDLHMIIESSVN